MTFTIGCILICIGIYAGGYISGYYWAVEADAKDRQDKCERDPYGGFVPSQPFIKKPFGGPMSYVPPGPPPPPPAPPTGKTVPKNNGPCRICRKPVFGYSWWTEKPEAPGSHPLHNGTCFQQWIEGHAAGLTISELPARPDGQAQDH